MNGTKILANDLEEHLNRQVIYTWSIALLKINAVRAEELEYKKHYTAQ